jgi:hypothetical protein
MDGLSRLVIEQCGAVIFTAFLNAAKSQHLDIVALPVPIAELLAAAFEQSQYRTPQDYAAVVPGPLPSTNGHIATRPSKVKRRLIVPGIVAKLNPNSSWAAALKMISRYRQHLPHRHVEFSDERLIHLASLMPEVYHIVRPLENQGCPHCSAVAAAVWLCWDACQSDETLLNVLSFFLSACCLKTTPFSNWLRSIMTRCGEKWKTRVLANCILVWNAQSTSAFDPDWEDYTHLPEPIRNADSSHKPQG